MGCNGAQVGNERLELKPAALRLSRSVTEELLLLSEVVTPAGNDHFRGVGKEVRLKSADRQHTFIVSTGQYQSKRGQWFYNVLLKKKAV